MSIQGKGRKAAVFPYDYGFYPYYKYRSGLQKLEIVKVLTMSGWGIAGKKALEIGGEDREDDIRAENAFGALDLGVFDILWVVESEHELEDQYLFQCIEIMVKSGKAVFISRTLNKGQRDKVKAICENSRASLIILSETEQESLISDEEEILYDLQTPVIAVGGIGEKTSKLEVQMAVRDRLQTDGYEVCWIATREEAVCWGGEKFPHFMYESGLTEKKKILMFNHYLKWIEQEKKPEVFLLGIPGEIMPDSKKQVGHFGITAYEVLQAVKPDFFVMSLYCCEMGKKYLEELSRVMKYKFNVEADCFYLSNTLQDVYSLNKITPVEYLLADGNSVEQKVHELTSSDIDMQIFSRSSYDSLYSYIIERLNGYEELKVL